MEAVSELELASLTAMWTVICCGQLFDPAVAADDGDIYRGLDILLACADDKVSRSQLLTFLFRRFVVASSFVLIYVICPCHFDAKFLGYSFIQESAVPGVWYAFD